MRRLEVPPQHKVTITHVVLWKQFHYCRPPSPVSSCKLLRVFNGMWKKLLSSWRCQRQQPIKFEYDVFWFKWQEIDILLIFRPNWKKTLTAAGTWWLESSFPLTWISRYLFLSLPRNTKAHFIRDHSNEYTTLGEGVSEDHCRWGRWFMFSTARWGSWPGNAAANSVQRSRISAPTPTRSKETRYYLQKK